MPGTTYSITTAREAAERDELADWVIAFLRSPGSDNAVLGEQLAVSHRWWLGPLELPIDQLHRLAGPPGQPVLIEIEPEEGWWRDDVADLAEHVEDGWEPPPVVLTWKHHLQQLIVEDGNHRLEALLRAGEERAWAVVGFERLEELEAFDPPLR